LYEFDEITLKKEYLVESPNIFEQKLKAKNLASKKWLFFNKNKKTKKQKK
jgi:hypothetical protein